MKIVCFLWGADRQYGPEHVNRLYQQLHSNLQGGFTLCCVTDDPTGLARHAFGEIKAYAMPESCRNVIRVAGGRCAKLFMFSDEFSAFINEQFIYLDLDVTIVGNIAPLVQQSTADLTIIAGGGKKSRRKRIAYVLRHGRLPESAPVNSSVLIVRPFENADLWDTFDPETGVSIVKKEKLAGDDQGWIYLVARERLGYIGAEQGVYRASMLRGRNSIPDNAKIIFFPGRWSQKPWMEDAIRNHPWMAQFQ